MCRATALCYAFQSIDLRTEKRLAEWLLANEKNSNDDARMQVELCKRESCPDWNKCPYAHAGEKAARRDPRIHYYRPEFCQGLRKVCMSTKEKAFISIMIYQMHLCNLGAYRLPSFCFE